MESLSYIISGQGTITVVIPGMKRHYSIPVSHPYYEELKEAVLARDTETVLDLADKAAAVERYSQGKVSIDPDRGEITYKGKPLHNAITERILGMLREGHPFEFMVTFLENVMQNPSKSSVDSLYDFLAHVGLPITEDGHFLAYKGVSHSFKDLFSNTIDNSVGRVVEVERNEVNDDRGVGCSTGLHAGTYEYARSYAHGAPVVLVKIHPKDVVSVPHDCGHQKLRTCRYEVLEVYEAEAPIDRTVFVRETDDFDDEDYEDFDDDDEDFEPSLI